MHDADPIVLETRSTELVRRAGDDDRRQVLAANVDIVLVVRALDVTLRAHRVAALVTMAWESGARPVVLLTKADRSADPLAAVRDVEAACPGVLVRAISVVTGSGIEDLRALLVGSTTVLLGESGAGKSTLTNALAGFDVLETGDVRRDGAGRHTTTHRELVLLPDGGAIIDTPGLREAAAWHDAAGVERAFADVKALAAACRFSDCLHETEPGCAVLGALAAGTLAPARLAACELAAREQRFIERKDDVRARAAERERCRAFSRSRRRDAW